MSTQPLRYPILGIILALAVTGVIACSDSGGNNGGTGATVTITAPGIVGPQGNLGANPPTLTVTNVTVSDGSGATYSFQVASDQAFTTIVQQITGIGQGSASTSWLLPSPLGGGTFFWRSRGVAGGTNGPWSTVAQITATGAPVLGAGETQVVFDPLTNGSSLGEVRGGSFTNQGWRVNSLSDYIRYAVPTVVSGYAEWQNVGLTQRNQNVNGLMLFGMWDPTAGAFRQNPFRVHLQKRFGPVHNPPFFRLRWISQGREDEAAVDVPAWNPSQVYTFRVEWGPSGAANRARVLLDEREVLTIFYNRPYQPNRHFIELGIEDRNESVIDAIYRNFTVVRR